MAREDAPQPGIFPDHAAPIVRNEAGALKRPLAENFLSIAGRRVEKDEALVDVWRAWPLLLPWVTVGGRFRK